MAFERITPGTPEWEAYYAGHIVRYEFAAGILASEPPQRLLDAACGVGYGAHFLARSGVPNIVAVDYDQGALGIAQKGFAHPGIRYLREDCQVLREAATHGPFDAVVSFETLEHLKQPGALLEAAAKALKPGGRIVVSTPNSRVSGGASEWEFHEREFTAPELEALLREANFGEIALYGQRETALGRLRDDLRAELNVIRSNPMFRLGRALQRLRHPGYGPLDWPLPERPGDFEIVPLAGAAACEAEGKAGPVVLLAVARRG